MLSDVLLTLDSGHMRVSSDCSGPAVRSLSPVPKLPHDAGNALSVRLDRKALQMTYGPARQRSAGGRRSWENRFDSALEHIPEKWHRFRGLGVPEFRHAINPASRKHPTCGKDHAPN